MNDLTPGIGHNAPPDPIDTITATYEAEREEAANWTDGTPVENEAQMNEVDALRKAMRQWRLDLERGQKDATAPLRAVYQAELDRWKPTIEDAKRIEGCLVATVDAFKKRLAEEKRAAERAAWEAAEKARREAEAKAQAAADLEAQREAEAARQAAIDAEKAAQAARKDQVKGMRTVTRYEITDHKALLHWIAKNDREAVTAFIEAWAQKNHKANENADGLRVWTEKEAF
ncbi:hypothetical protein [Roseovarius mucosus]|uniref:hypothetical protein n=1 Tax=Roseovarius mucosus TaxID=215743 RepID=UPI0035D01B2D